MKQLKYQNINCTKVIMKFIKIYKKLKIVKMMFFILLIIF